MFKYEIGDKVKCVIADREHEFTVTYRMSHRLNNIYFLSNPYFWNSPVVEESRLTKVKQPDTERRFNENDPYGEENWEV